MSKKETLSLAERLKRLFSADKKTTEAPVQAKPAAHKADDMAFKAGAAVTFITPIGAYAGNTTEKSERIKAEQMFRHMDTSSNSTIN